MREGWTYKKMSEVFDLQMGKTPDRKTPSYFGGNNVWVSIRDLVGKEIGESNEHITDTAVTTTNIRKVKKGTVIMSFKLTVGKCAITTKDLYTNEAIMAFNLKEGYDIYPDYLYYYLSNYNWRGANKAVMGITLNKATISQQKVSYPSLSEQQTIVAELDKINELISLKKAQLSDLDSLAQSIFYDMFGDPIENEKGWEVKKLEDVCETITDGDHMPPPKSENGIPFITISDINKETREIDFNNTFYVPQDYYDGLKKERKAQVNDLLYTVTGSYGIPVVVKSSMPFCFQRHIALIRPIQEKLLTIFLCWWVLCPSVKGEADRVATGIAQKTVGLNSIRQFSIILPPLSLQQEFAKRIELIEQQKAQISSTINDLETLLSSRMQYWFD